MKVAEIMTRGVETVSPADTIREAARKMDALNVGVLPVCDGDVLVGMITDRDITVRATAAGLDPNGCRIEEVMTDDLVYCFEEDDLETATERMKGLQVRRLPVLDRNKRLVGILALGDMATEGAAVDEAAEALEGISSPSAPDRPGSEAGPPAE